MFLTDNYHKALTQNALKIAVKAGPSQKTVKATLVKANQNSLSLLEIKKNLLNKHLHCIDFPKSCSNTFSIMQYVGYVRNSANI